MSFVQIAIVSACDVERTHVYVVDTLMKFTSVDLSPVLEVIPLSNTI